MRWAAINFDNLRAGFAPGERAAMLNAESAVLRAEVGRREREGALTPEEAAEELKGIDARAEALWLAAVQAAATELVAEIRAEVASSGRVAMNAEPLTVPEGLLRSATSVLRYHLLTRYNCQISEDRKQTYLDAKELLAAVRRGEVNLDPAADALPRPSYRRRKSKNFTVNRPGIM